MTAGAEAFPPAWYGMSGADHFWMRWRLAVWLRRMRERGVDLGGPARAFDIGCGAGTFSRQVEAATGWTVDGADSAAAVSRAPAGRGRMTALDIFAFPPELSEAYDHVFLFDVIEHVADPRGFVRAALRYLKPGGLLHVNVPALQSLFSAYDRVQGHFRRYDRESLRGDIEGAGLGDVRMGYWGLSLLPYALARKWRLGGSADRDDVMRRGFVPPGRAADLLLRAQMKAETALFSSTILGTSVMMTGRKEG